MTDDVQARIAHAIRLQQAGDLAQAEAAYRDLLAAGCATPPVLANLAIILRGRAAFDEAEALLRRAIGVAPEIAGLSLNLGTSADWKRPRRRTSRRWPSRPVTPRSAWGSPACCSPWASTAKVGAPWRRARTASAPSAAA